MVISRDLVLTRTSEVLVLTRTCSALLYSPCFYMLVLLFYMIYKRWREERTVKRKRGSGRPRKINQRQDRRLIRLVKQDPMKTVVDMLVTFVESMSRRMRAVIKAKTHATKY
uniref:Uncharacterized protein n=1 Tax=Acrobeloides nanus TaxID=290746 RepID=A0A914C9J8_9BILA